LHLFSGLTGAPLPSARFVGPERSNERTEDYLDPRRGSNP
jgi:hypothetical protein